MKIKKYLLLSFLSFFFFAFFVRFSWAAELVLFSENKNPKIGDIFELKVLISTQEDINAIEGEVFFPQEILELKDIRNNNSLVSLWIKDPSQLLKNQEIKKDKIQFGGIIPGGYKGNGGLLFSLFFEVKREGTGVIEIRNSKVLLNDGQGTPAPLRISSFYFSSLAAKSESSKKLSLESSLDKEPPEFFVPQIAYDENIEGGKWFVAFLTVDKQSGIDSYQIKEVRSKIFSNFLGRWIKAESPYILKDQDLKSFIFVKAVDRSGNERIVKISPPRGLEWYRNYDSLILEGGAFIILLILSFLFTKFIKLLKRM
ncbi:MAG: cohesin domain-containing protein [Patescibacteria group bacterium]|nr:cohesin domain-containing protein [Patescibacteria group bacterium]